MNSPFTSSCAGRIKDFADLRSRRRNSLSVSSFLKRKMYYSDSRSRRNNTSFLLHAFTLIELLIVVVLIALLSFIVILSLYKVRSKAKLSRTSDELTTLAKAADEYAQDNGGYPGDVSRGVPSGIEKYLPNNTLPVGAWSNASYDWDSWPYTYHGSTSINGTPVAYQQYLGQQVVQVTYHLCNLGDLNPAKDCVDPILFPTFVADSGIFYCINGPCIPHQDEPEIPGYCVNCKIKPVNY